MSSRTPRPGADLFAEQSPPLSPLRPAPSPDEFKITIDCLIEGRRSIYSPERDQERDTFADIVEDIVSGELEYVSRVARLNVDDGTSRDVTEDVARAVLAVVCERGIEPGRALRDFLDQQLGPLTIDQELMLAEEAG